MCCGGALSLRDPLVLSAFAAPLLPLALLHRVLVHAVARGVDAHGCWLAALYATCLLTWALSLVYHGSHETRLTLLEPLVVHATFALFVGTFARALVANLCALSAAKLALLVAATFACYAKASGRGAREGRARTRDYRVYHSGFHVAGSLLLAQILFCCRA